MTCETRIHDGIEKEGGRMVHVCMNPRLDDPGMNDLMIWIGTQKWGHDGLAPDGATECPDFEPMENT